MNCISLNYDTLFESHGKKYMLCDKLYWKQNGNSELYR